MRAPLRVALVAGAAVVLLGGMRLLFAHDPSERGLEFFPDMAVTPARKAFTADACFSDGKTEQPLPAGVVVRDRAPFPYRATPEDAARAGEELANPFAADDAAALARGAQRFATFCVVCHDANGGGRGTAVQRGMVPPPSLLAERAKTLKDGQLFHVLTLGQGNMASYAAQLAAEDRWKVILHIRKLQKAATGGGP
jgi:mono/diheme cytochrome c family protein